MGAFGAFGSRARKPTSVAGTARATERTVFSEDEDGSGSGSSGGEAGEAAENKPVRANRRRPRAAKAAKAAKPGKIGYVGRVVSRESKKKSVVKFDSDDEFDTGGAASDASSAASPARDATEPESDGDADEAASEPESSGAHDEPQGAGIDEEAQADDGEESGGDADDDLSSAEGGAIDAPPQHATPRARPAATPESSGVPPPPPAPQTEDGSGRGAAVAGSAQRPPLPTPGRPGRRSSVGSSARRSFGAPLTWSSPAIRGKEGQRNSVSSPASSVGSQEDGNGLASIVVGWTEEEHRRLVKAASIYGLKWKKVQLEVGTKTLVQCREYGSAIGLGPQTAKQAKARARELARIASTSAGPTEKRLDVNPQPGGKDGAAGGAGGAAVDVAAPPGRRGGAAEAAAQASRAIAGSESLEARKGRRPLLKWHVVKAMRDGAEERRQRRRERKERQEAARIARRSRRASIVPGGDAALPKALGGAALSIPSPIADSPAAASQGSRGSRKSTDSVGSLRSVRSASATSTTSAGSAASPASSTGTVELMFFSPSAERANAAAGLRMMRRLSVARPSVAHMPASRPSGGGAMLPGRRSAARRRSSIGRVSMGGPSLASQPGMNVRAVQRRLSRLSIGSMVEEGDEDADEEEEGDDVLVSFDAASVASASTTATQPTVTLDAVLSMVLEFVPMMDLLTVTPLVSREWCRLSATVFSWLAASDSSPGMSTDSSLSLEDASGQHAPLLRNWRGLQSAYPWAAFLSEGAYKAVYRVWCAARRRFEAVSVMDVGSIAASGNYGVVRQEVHCGCLLSELVRTGVCPNFVETYQVFHFAYEPAADAWGTPENRKPTGECPFPASEGRGKRSKRHKVPRKPSADGVYQYIRMELCCGGDAEDHMRDISEQAAAAGTDDGGVLPMTDVAGVLLQLAYGLYAARERLYLRHYDVKLLNVLLKPAADVVAGMLAGAGDAAAEDGVEVLNLRYGFGEHVYQVPLSTVRGTGNGGGYVAKWADYGTADTSADTLGRGLAVQHFTTLENSPPEWLLLGDAAKPGYASDTWMLGLSLLHLLTGDAPYEEVLEDARCPAGLAAALEAAWAGEAFRPGVSQSRRGRRRARGARRGAGGDGDDACGYSVLGVVLEDDVDGVMVDTLYRLLVLLGVPDFEALGWSTRSAAARSVVHCLTDATVDDAPKGLTRAMVQEAKRTYEKDCSVFSLAEGSAPLMVRARARMAQLPGCERLLRRLLAWQPSNRPSMHDVISDDMLASMRWEAAAEGDSDGEMALEYMAYFTGSDGNGTAGGDTAFRRDL